MGLEHVRRVFEEWGARDPMHAVLTRKGYEGQWDAEAFFRRGREEIDSVLDDLKRRGVVPGSRRALDFGCGLGRLSQALATHFDRVVGVDISSSMVEGARRHDRSGGRVTYLVNDAPDLRQLETATFDFIYSSKTLQHIPPRYQASYIGEFMRLLHPGGHAVFQARNGPYIRPGSLRERLYTLRREHLRRLIRRLLRKPAYEMHYLARSRVEELVQAGGGRVVDVVDLSLGRPGRSLRYLVAREATDGAGSGQPG